jgi:hypothetical protein
MLKLQQWDEWNWQDDTRLPDQAATFDAQTFARQ